MSKQLRFADVVREILYPLKNTAIVIAVLFFWFIFSLADWGGAFGIPLLLITVPAYIRYLIYLLETHANGRSPPVPDLSMFNPIDNLWSLTPAIFVAIFLLADALLAVPGFIWAAFLLGVALLLIAPSSLAILAVTHSPTESLNPVAIAKMIRICGAAYLLVPAVAVLLYLLLRWLDGIGIPAFLIDLGKSYQAILFFTLTGALLHANNVVEEVAIFSPLATSDTKVSADLVKERQRVANHAYGFVSRNNRAGGLAHINQWIDKETDTDAAYAWFFQEMLTWESSTAALFFAQQYLRHLLHGEQEGAALKLAARCLHQDPRWKPQHEDRDVFLELAERHGRNDLIRQMKR